MNNNSKRKTDGTSKNNWRTPPWLWERLQAEFRFDVDGASDGTDNLLPNYHTIETMQSKRYEDWKNKKVFINPPFNQIGYYSGSQNWWLSGANYGASIGSYPFLCFLIPFADETKHFQNWVWPYATVFSFNKRINYVDPANIQVKKGVAFSSCLAVYSRDPVDTTKLKGLGRWIKAIS